MATRGFSAPVLFQSFHRFAHVFQMVPTHPIQGKGCSPSGSRKRLFPVGPTRASTIQPHQFRRLIWTPNQTRVLEFDIHSCRKTGTSCCSSANGQNMGAVFPPTFRIWSTQDRIDIICQAQNKLLKEKFLKGWTRRVQRVGGQIKALLAFLGRRLNVNRDHPLWRLTEWTSCRSFALVPAWHWTLFGRHLKTGTAATG